jgi:translation initiation factor IF-3
MKKADNRTNVNENIVAKEVRLIDENAEQLGIVSFADALARAQSVGLDLVQISNADPIVCKIMDFGKKLYEEKKAKNAAKKKQTVVQVKEMKFRPNTDIGDYNIKIKALTRFLEGGDKAKVTLRFRGREMAHQRLGMDLMMRIEEDLKELGTVEQRPKMEGRQMTMVIGSIKKK